MRFLYPQPELEQAFAAARTADDMDALLTRIVRLPERFRTPDIYGRRLFARGLDGLVPRMAAFMQLRDQPARERSNANVCILATRFYPTGGHGRIAQELIERLQPAGAVTLLTDIYRELRYADFFNQPTNRSFIGERACLVPGAELLVERVLETYMMLAAMRPTRILLMSHPMDLVAVLAAWPFRDVVEFVHHADHVPALGATLPFAAHVDVTYTCHLACREAGLDAAYAGMVAPLAPPVAPRARDGELRIATCGSVHKYRGQARHRWADYVVAALSRPGTRLFHIGETDEAFRSELVAALTAAGIALDRYVLTGYRPSLPAELAAQGADAYLASYPETGAKANLEAMMAGVPVLVPGDDDQPPLVRYRSPLPGWRAVSEPGDLDAGLDWARARRTGPQDAADIAALAQEAARFDDFAAGRPLAPTPSEDRLA